ncbi:hypothetical protein Bca52824_082971 [Brassica carinata]|uniref:Uncharacterized protein n=1 Tax=Brassica carinata TaxID=52824 RepID=A0A8X7PKI2_BRACI|nr:hypothetical protein Bca52824_082971 [Brassica carinata]
MVIIREVVFSELSLVGSLDGPTVSDGACGIDCLLGDPLPSALADLPGECCTNDKSLFFELAPLFCFGLTPAVLNFAGLPLFLPEVLVGGSVTVTLLGCPPVVVSPGPMSSNGAFITSR